MSDTIGVIGLGIMGGAMARNLLKNGFKVVGFDVSPDAVKDFESHGGRGLTSVAAVVQAAPVLFTSLPTVSSFETVLQQLVEAKPADRIVVEVSTLPLSAKRRALESLEPLGCKVLDCPVSGTGAQAATQDLVVFASGDRPSFDRVSPALGGMSRRQVFLGAFGVGTTMKFIANHLVAIHNAAAAEAFVLASKAGVDLATVFDTLQDSAGTSRMFQVRGPLMVEGRYDEPTARITMFLKDLDVIGDFAAGLRCPTPLFDLTTQMYYAAHSAGYGALDTAAVIRVFENLAGLPRR